MPRRQHTQMQWEMKFFRCGCCCFYCREPLILKRATKDHLIPTSRGGSDDISNIVPACFYCNVKKGKKTDKEFLAVHPYLSVAYAERTAIDEPKHLPNSEEKSTISYELLDNPHLLDDLRSEEANVSWAWRHPR